MRWLRVAEVSEDSHGENAEDSSHGNQEGMVADADCEEHCGYDADGEEHNDRSEVSESADRLLALDTNSNAWKDSTARTMLPVMKVAL